MPSILFTGGGSAGHVTPNIGLIERLLHEGWQVDYVGSKSGIESEIIPRLGIPYHVIATGKLRRYFSWQNFIDPFRILLGLLQSIWLCARLRPDVLFSKGGFVSVPVVVAAWLSRIPVITHESDVTPGLANRLNMPFARHICLTFAETKELLHSHKAVLSGTPLRRVIRDRDAGRAQQFLNRSASTRPCLLVFGGSLGASTINAAIREVLDLLLARFDVIHVCGAGNLDDSLKDDRYWQYEFLHEEFGDILALADVVVARAGANSIYELLACRKPHVLIPLGRQASRGDQIENAKVFEKRGFSVVIFEDELSSEKLVSQITRVFDQRTDIGKRLEEFEVLDSEDIICKLITSVAS